jgi:hypothetical protein
MKHPLALVYASRVSAFAVLMALALALAAVGAPGAGGGDPGGGPPLRFLPLAVPGRPGERHARLAQSVHRGAVARSRHPHASRIRGRLPVGGGGGRAAPGRRRSALRHGGGDPGPAGGTADRTVSPGGERGHAGGGVPPARAPRFRVEPAAGTAGRSLAIARRPRSIRWRCPGSTRWRMAECGSGAGPVLRRDPGECETGPGRPAGLFPPGGGGRGDARRLRPSWRSSIRNSRRNWWCSRRRPGWCRPSPPSGPASIRRCGGRSRPR